MKASIDAQGVLTIKAEADIEHYALAKWWDDWLNKRSLLQVEIAHESIPNTVVHRQVKNLDE